MPTQLVPSLAGAQAPRPRRGRRGRHGRRVAGARRLALAALAAVPLLALPPRVAAATPESYAQCLNAADGWYLGCMSGADGWGEQLACKWAGGMLIFGCAAAEALEMLAKSITVPRYQI